MNNNNDIICIGKCEEVYKYKGYNEKICEHHSRLQQTVVLPPAGRLLDNTEHGARPLTAAVIAIV